MHLPLVIQANGNNTEYGPIPATAYVVEQEHNKKIVPQCNALARNLNTVS